MKLKEKLNIIIGSLILSMVFILSSSTVSAEEVTCTVVYGQGEICGVSTTEEVIHTPVEAGVGDVDFILISTVLSGFGMALKAGSKMTKRMYFLDK